MFHNEVDGTAAFTATETFTDPFRGRYTERGCLLVVERTETNIVYTPSPKRNKIGYDLQYVGGIHDFIYGLLIDHRICGLFDTKVQYIFEKISILFLCSNY